MLEVLLLFERVSFLSLTERTALERFQILLLNERFNIPTVRHHREINAFIAVFINAFITVIMNVRVLARLPAIWSRSTRLLSLTLS